MNTGRIKHIVTNTHYLRKGCEHLKYFPSDEKTGKPALLKKIEERDKWLSYAIDSGMELLLNAKHYEKLGKSGCVGLASNQIGLNQVKQFMKGA